eukprot:gene10368-2897_t
MNQFITYILIIACLSLTCSAQFEPFPNITIKQSALDVIKFWTEERIASAKPMDIPIAPFLEKIKQTKPNSVDPLATNIVRSSYSNSPYKVAGKLYFTSNGKQSSCTASVLGTDILLTAGHCVHDGKSKFHTNVMFIPQYKGGQQPLGRWTGVRLYTTAGWGRGNGGGFARDVGVVKLSKNNGRTIYQAVGAKLTPIYNTGRNLNVRALGYPGNIGGGSSMVESTGRMSTGSSYTPPTVKIPSTMTFGASGGPWVVNNLQVNGLNSHILSNPSQYMYSPYFDNTIKRLIDYATTR